MIKSRNIALKFSKLNICYYDYHFLNKTNHIVFCTDQEKLPHLKKTKTKKTGYIFVHVCAKE